MKDGGGYNENICVKNTEAVCVSGALGDLQKKLSRNFNFS
jgi:hypothetical protein